MGLTGVTARGVVMPIFKQGDNLSQMICDTLVKTAKAEGFAFNDRDVLSVTEAVVARTQGNYATCEQIAKDINNKTTTDTIGVLFPILSRNRFSMILKSIALTGKKVIVQLSYPCDEVGNSFITYDMIDDAGINPYSDNFTEKQFRDIFGMNTKHLFTGVDYIEFYKSFGKKIEIVFSNNPHYILNYTSEVINCDIHTRKRTKRILQKANAKTVLSLDDVLSSSVDGSGYSEYGVLGSNKATEDTVKLFPRDCKPFVLDLQAKLLKVTGKKIEVMIYGDGGFKDPVGGIWEFADPVVSPAFTDGLKGTPNEIKIKYIADNKFAHLQGEALDNAMREEIRNKERDLTGNMQSEGTTPRQLTDLLGSLSDLVSGSGDRGTPVVLIQGYFTNFAS